MPPLNNPWNSLEIVKLVLGVLTPLSVACLGWLVARRLKRLELVQWTNQKLIEKRLALYDAVAPLLNQLLCFYTWIGHWKDISPDDVIRAKRELDRTFHIYRYLFGDDVYDAYHTYIHALFETHTGAGQDARIRSLIEAPNGDRTKHGTYAWNPAWYGRFATANVVDGAEVRAHYIRLMEVLRVSLGANR
ncbi:hypothetical protein WI73_13125 [Burkholderia ubonensis]|uniref:Uncharacterized protein n=1 Tax=Burkholderia ubonensis TaxID=101571 RepID=A0A102KQ58_9BURK|nr:hypothetical protein [Burkholderia ubonensis]AOI72385.1 hypothetical protein WI31_22570 [Burkholderia ubonensis]KUZ11872.1 hypothetical protein WI29_28730 [Burkholderia ubonensis]KUZ35694.1 hypothetical protein WI30_11390 [Burkholderia ubonensis]KUZ39221.1 hypothetical protein WI32_11430 [Burkholderia ubonensis]KUZ45682.1 hypothetical protein WI33_27170 [Burkholderia ubonensis]